MLEDDYIQRISHRLRNFSQKKKELYNFSCPFCGDSKRVKWKARGYLMVYKGVYFYKCHNCSLSYNFKQFLEQLDLSLSREYVAEKFLKNDNSGSRTNFKKKQKNPSYRKQIDLPNVKSLSLRHPASSFLRARKIPQKFYREIYWAENYSDWIKEICGKELKDDTRRIVLPVFNRQKKLIGCQGRAIDSGKVRYNTTKFGEERLLFNEHKVNRNLPIFVVEGPIDSLFLNNAVATLGSDLEAVLERFASNNLTFVFDNEPRNSQIVKNMEELLDSGQKVCIWPDTIKEKDINDMILSGINVREIIAKNTFKSLKGLLRFTEWKKL